MGTQITQPTAPPPNIPSAQDSADRAMFTKTPSGTTSTPVINGGKLSGSGGKSGGKEKY